MVDRQKQFIASFFMFVACPMLLSFFLVAPFVWSSATAVDNLINSTVIQSIVMKEKSRPFQMRPDIIVFRHSESSLDILICLFANFCSMQTIHFRHNSRLFFAAAPVWLFSDWASLFVFIVQYSWKQFNKCWPIHKGIKYWNRFLLIFSLKLNNMQWKVANRRSTIRRINRNFCKHMLESSLEWLSTMINFQSEFFEQFSYCLF